jgi:glutaminyl-tRNA synthetase
VIENYPENQTEEMEVPNHPNDPSMGTRKVPFGRVIYVEQDDFMENPEPKYFRLGPGREVRLRSAYFVKCTGFEKDASGRVTEIRCTYDPATRGGNAPDGRKVKGTLHWVAEKGSLQVEVRLYDRLFNHPSPGEGDTDYLTQINPSSFERLTDCRLEPSLAQAKPEARYQFERQGFFCADRVDTKPGRPVFNRTVTLRDTWQKK